MNFAPWKARLGGPPKSKASTMPGCVQACGFWAIDDQAEKSVMAINITNFIVTAEREGFPVQLLRFVWSNFKTEVGSSNKTSRALETLYLTDQVVVRLQMAALGIRWERGNRPGEFKKETNVPETTEVGSLYHEATHAYLILRTARSLPPAERKHFVALLDRAEEYYKGVRVRHSNEDYVADDPWYISNEAAAEYVANRARCMWYALDELHDILRKDLGKEQPDLDAVRRRVENARLGYDKLISEKVFGYEKDGGDEYRVLNKEIPKFLSSECDLMLENKIPSNFMAAPKLAHLYRQVMRQIAFGPDRGVPPRVR